jgi:hypothetical protein
VLAPVGQIWVAAGTYRPDRGTLDRLASFRMQSGLGLYGGFAGWETQLEQRDPAANPTILSGDLRGDDGPDFTYMGDNSYHVVAAVGTELSALLDGFVIRGGNAPNLGGDDSVGGGLTLRDGEARVVGCQFERNRANFGGALYCYRSHLTLRHCTFTQNAALTSAGAAFVHEQSAPVLSVCTFSANRATLQGGALVIAVNSQAVLLNCGFYGNTASSYGGGAVLNNNSRCSFINCALSGNASYGAVHGGGGLRNERGSAELINCTLYGNSAVAGGWILNFLATGLNLANCILWGNTDSTGSGEAAQLSGNGAVPSLHHCCVQGWTGTLGGTGNFGYDPLLIDPDGPDDLPGTPDDLIQPDGCSSPCTNTGDNAALPPDEFDLDGDGDLSEPLPLDLAGNPRVYDGRVDRGAYETVAQQCLRGDLNCDGCVTFRDINPFVLALSNPAAYYLAYPDCYLLNGDCNYDGVLNFGDINPFVAILSGR